MRWLSNGSSTSLTHHKTGSRIVIELLRPRHVPENPGQPETVLDGTPQCWRHFLMSRDLWRWRQPYWVPTLLVSGSRKQRSRCSPKQYLTVLPGTKPGQRNNQYQTLRFHHQCLRIRPKQPEPLGPLGGPQQPGPRGSDSWWDDMCMNQ